MMRRGLRAVLQQTDDIEVVGEAADAASAIGMYVSCQPDVTLMDLSMPGGGIEAIRAIRVIAADACIVALTTYAGDGRIVRALNAGAAGYVLKTAMCDDAPAVVLAAHAGRLTLEPDIAAAAVRGRLQQLTQREREVLTQVAKGYGNRRIGEELGISEETVKSYLSNIMQKLHASDRAHAVATALRHGFLD
jgi:DNA-binding NarL/FixJ family response regulator